MKIRSLHVQNYRIYPEVELDWGSRINLLSGPNGAGKTNLIDAIHYLCMSRSFVTSSDSHAINMNASSFHLKGSFTGTIRPIVDIEISYQRGEGKSILVNGVKLDRLSDLIGRVPVVVLSPDDRQLTFEGPEYRRNFLDAMISQVDAAYLHDLIDYRRVMRQRNRLLLSYGASPSKAVGELEPWNVQFVRLAARIINKRNAVLQTFGSYLERAYSLMAGMNHTPSFRYKTVIDNPDEIDRLERKLEEELHARLSKDLERGVTTVGPHRDDITFLLDGLELRRFGSQGQHRLFALSLKLAELYFFSDMLDDLPIFLLDDVFGDLDSVKTAVLMRMLAEHPGQVCITAANTTLLESLIDWSDTENRLIMIDSGTVSITTDTSNHVRI
jgi:DNA replication and repair protein RecF